MQQTERMTRIIRHLLDFSRRRGPQLVRYELQRLVADAVEILSPLAKSRQATIAVDAREHVPAAVDPTQMLQALTNLMVNGMQAMSEGGCLKVAVGHRHVRPPADHAGEEGEYACISVVDQGEGIEREVLEHVFEPFFTTKDVGEGTGSGSRWRTGSSGSTAAGSRSRPSAGVAVNSRSCCGRPRRERAHSRVDDDQDMCEMLAAALARGSTSSIGGPRPSTVWHFSIGRLRRRRHRPEHAAA